jgi:hypothetical protein
MSLEETAPDLDGEQFENKSCGFLPHDLPPLLYLEISFDICKRKVLCLFASLQCPSSLKDSSFSQEHMSM